MLLSTEIFKAYETLILRNFVSGLQLKVVTRTLVDKLRFDCRDCLFTDQTTSKWCANDLVALVKDHASNITAFVFVLCAFVDLDCGHVF